MTILSYSSQELEDYLVELTCENPMAELIRPQEPQPDAEGDFIQQLRWLRQSDRQNRSYYVNENEKSIPAAAPADDALSDFLHEQLMTKSLSKPLSHTLNVLIDCLDDHGFYSGTAGELGSILSSIIIHPDCIPGSITVFRGVDKFLTPLWIIAICF